MPLPVFIFASAKTYEIGPSMAHAFTVYAIRNKSTQQLPCSHTHLLNGCDQFTKYIGNGLASPGSMNF